MAFLSRLRRLGSLLIVLLVALLFARPGAAQTSSAIVIDTVDDSAFPQVDVDVTVQGAAAQRPLTVADFQLFEDGRRVPASSILVETGDAQPMNLVIAVDVSTEPADLAQIQNGLLTLVDRLTPGDQVMLISFFDEVRLVQPLTDNLDQVRNAIRQLTPGGAYTALNRATVEAFAQAQLLPVGRRAVLIVTDSVENLSDATVNVNGAGAIPAYVVAYSPKVQAPGAMDAFAQQISADLTRVETATAAQIRLQTLSLATETRSYHLRFTSALPADDNDHTISINLSDGNAADRDNSLFRARPGAVTVETGLANGAQVGGLVALTPQISSPAPVREVEYLLNGRRVAVIDTPPFFYTVDTTQVTPGNNVIGVRVTDGVGNQAEQLVTVSVVDALQVNVRTQPERYYLGDSVQIIADVTALNGVRSVDFLLNGIVVAEVAAPPYVFTLETTGYSAGAVPVTVRAYDVTGYTKSADAPVVLSAPPPRFFFTQEVWLRILAVAAIVLAVVLTWLLLLFFASLARRQRRARFVIEVHNEGNQASAYLVRADDPKGRLTFSFLLKGLRLQGRTLTDWEPIPQAAQSARPRSVAPATAQPQPMTQAAQPVAVVAQPAQQQAAAGPSARERIGQGASWFSTVAQSFVGLFGTLGRLLPQSMGGAALSRASSSAGQAYSQSVSVYRLNQEVEGASSRLKEGKQQLAPAAQSGAKMTAAAQPALATASAPATTQAQAQPQMPAAPAVLPAPMPLPAPSARSANGHHTAPIDTADLRTDANGVTYRRVVRRDLNAAWTETPEVAPGDTLQLEMLIEPNRVGRTWAHPFQVRSLPVAESAGTPLITEGSAKIRGVSWLLWFFLPSLVVLVAAAVVLFMLAFLLAEFGLLPDLSGLPIPWLPLDLF
ncbi:MAG: VWA domain-containing protein [Caldilineaceae bacterium]